MNRPEPSDVPRSLAPSRRHGVAVGATLGFTAAVGGFAVSGGPVEQATASFSLAVGALTLTLVSAFLAPPENIS